MSKSMGEAIHQSAKLLSQAGKEINALMDMIQAEVNSEIEQNQLGCDAQVHGNWYEESNLDDSTFLFNLYAIVLPIKKGKRKQSAQSYINIQVSLDSDGMTHPQANNLEPLAHISLWNVPTNIAEDEYMSLDLVEDTELEIQDNFLVSWGTDAEDWTDQCWTYSLKLTSLNSPEDVRNKIIIPFSQLMKTNNPIAAGLDKIEGIIRYEEITPRLLKVI
ncbi:hypothetical protein [Marinospirillum insulare]|uniref:Uncharacterized protein n=1 Tax=Marinospirillum insulare TaxID=217169 RepID=A0ABQ5ZZ64_9GAMM|nr:hypothetical protein [Marinospirillum insulare]GLR63961.1 hypothetical protein GCM10007878_13990 [Marinospirillum insulare]